MSAAAMMPAAIPETNIRVRVEDKVIINGRADLNQNVGICFEP